MSDAEARRREFQASPEELEARIRELEEFVEDPAEDEVVVYVDEVDVHLNPKMGLDWMVRGQEKQVLTPGQNERRYLAGALDARTGEVVWVESHTKNDMLFVYLEAASKPSSRRALETSGQAMCCA